MACRPGEGGRGIPAAAGLAQPARAALSAVRLPDSVRGRGGIHPQSGGRGRAADGFGIPAHTPIHNRDERGGVLRWRTARPLTLHPAKVVRASIIPPASWMPAAAQGVPGVLCLRIEGIAGLSLAKFGLPSLSLHLGGDRFATFPMHEWVHGACKDVFLADDAGAAKPRALSLGREALCHAGLEPGGRLFPESAYALPGYQLLQEYFAYPEHLLFWEVGGLERRRELGDLPGFDLLFPVDAPAAENGLLKIVPHLRRTCGQLVRAHGGTPSGWITSARDTCSCRICGTGTVRKSIP